MDRENIFALARKNGATSREAYRFCEIVAAEVAKEREACAKQLELTGPDVLLMAGEMTRGELGTVMAVLSCLRVRMRSNV